MQLPRVASMFGLFFAARAVTDFDGASAADHGRYARFFNGMLARGHYLPPSGYEVIFVSLAHTDADIDATVAAAKEVAQDLG